MRFQIRPLHCYLVIIAALILYPIFYGTHVASSGDTPGYQEAANTILNGYHQINFRVPVYPLLLIATGSVKEINTSLFFVQFLLYFLSVWLLVTAMLKSGISKAVVLVITLILVSPLLVKIVYLALTEAVTFSLVNILFALFVLLKGNYKFLLLGLLAAILTLTRPSFQLTGLLLTVLFFFYERNKWRAIMFLVAFATPIVLFSSFNKARFNFSGITPATGWHLTTKTALFIEDWPDVSMRPLMIRQRNDNLINKSSHTGSMFVWTLPGKLQDSLHQNYVEVSKYMMKNNLALIKAQPLSYLEAVGRSLFQYTLPNGPSAKDPGIVKALYTLVQFAYVYLALALTAVVLVCVWLFRKRINAVWLYPFLVTAIIIYSNYFVSIAAEVGDARHRAPTEALILICIAYALPIVSFCRRAVKSLPATI